MRRISKSVQSHRTAARQLSELSWAVPQVVSHRLTRLAFAGATPKASDQREFTAMVAEKHQAFVESWWAMGTETLRQQQSLTLALFGGWSPRAAANPLAAGQRVLAQMVDGPMQVAHQGLKPVHQKAVANAKRLGGRKRR
jgi:hypothetical protein